MYNSEIKIKNIILNKIAFRIRQTIPSYAFNNSDLSMDSMTDIISGEMVYALQTYLTAHEWSDILSEEKSEKYLEVPAEWHDAFRLKYFPKFLVAKFPIKMRKITIEYKTIKNSKNTWVFPMIPPNPNKDIEKFVMNYVERQEPHMNRRPER